MGSADSCEKIYSIHLLNNTCVTRPPRLLQRSRSPTIPTPPPLGTSDAVLPVVAVRVHGHGHKHVHKHACGHVQEHEPVHMQGHARVHVCVHSHVHVQDSSAGAPTRDAVLQTMPESKTKKVFFVADFVTDDATDSKISASKRSESLHV